MNEILILIDGKEYKIKKTKLGFSVGTMFLFKKLTGKQFYNIDFTDFEDMVYLIYSGLKACNKEFNYSFEEFCEYIDDNPEVFEKFRIFDDNIDDIKVVEETGEKKSN